MSKLTSLSEREFIETKNYTLLVFLTILY